MWFQPFLEVKMTSEPSLDPQEWTPVSGKKAALCKNCHRVQPQEDFEYYLTRAQARAQGYKGAVRVLHDSGLICSACRPRRKTLKELPARALWTRVAEGDLPEPLVQRLIQQREEGALHAQRTARDRQWVENFTAAWAPTLSSITRELHAVEQSEKHVLANLRAVEGRGFTGEDVFTKCHVPAARERAAFYAEYKTLLRALRSKLKTDNIMAPGRRSRPWHTSWVHYIEELWPHRRAELGALWEAIPLTTRTTLRMPAIMNALGEKSQVPQPVEVTPLTDAQLRKQALAGGAVDEWLDTNKHPVRTPPGRKPKPPEATPSPNAGPKTDKRQLVPVPKFLLLPTRGQLVRKTPADPPPTEPEVTPENDWGADI